MELRGVQRRLTAILAVDVVGYPRLMEADEERALAALKAHRRELVSPAIAARCGRIVKTTGDGDGVNIAARLEGMREPDGVWKGAAASLTRCGRLVSKQIHMQKTTQPLCLPVKRNLRA